MIVVTQTVTGMQTGVRFRYSIQEKTLRIYHLETEGSNPTKKPGRSQRGSEKQVGKP